MQLVVRTTTPEGFQRAVLELLEQRIKQAVAVVANSKKIRDKHCARAEVAALRSILNEVTQIKIEAP